MDCFASLAMTDEARLRLLDQLARLALAGFEFGDGPDQPLCVLWAAQQVGRFLVRREVLQRDQHGRRLAAVARDEHGRVVVRHAVERGGEVLAEVAVGGGAHESIVRDCVPTAIFD